MVASIQKFLASIKGCWKNIAAKVRMSMRRKNYKRTLRRCGFAPGESRICMVLYDRLGIEFACISRPGGFSLQVGKRDEDGRYRKVHFADSWVFDGRGIIFFCIMGGSTTGGRVFSFRELSRRYPHLGIPEFETERELEMKLDLMEISP